MESGPSSKMAAAAAFPACSHVASAGAGGHCWLPHGHAQMVPSPSARVLLSALLSVLVSCFAFYDMYLILLLQLKILYMCFYL